MDAYSRNHIGQEPRAWMSVELRAGSALFSFLSSQIPLPSFYHSPRRHFSLGQTAFGNLNRFANLGC
jgi:hypothetical protein